MPEYPEEDDEIEDDGTSEEAPQEQMSAQRKKQMEIEEKILKNKLRVAMVRLAKGSLTLTPDELKTIKSAKKHKNLAKEIMAVDTLLAANKVRMAMKVMSTTPAWYYIGIGCLILLLIIVVVCIIANILPYLFPNDSGNGQLNSVFGVTGKDFYGARVVYRDDEQASINMIENYVELVEKGIDEAEKIPNVTVNIVMPEEEYDYSAFEETIFQSSYPVLYTTIFDIAKVVYEEDNASAFTGSSLIECTNGILYFGFGESVMTEIEEVIADVIIANYSIEGEGENVDSQISSSLSTLFSDSKYFVRAEKLFVKDHIISGEDERISGMTTENYVAFIFMPKNSVTFTKFSFAAGGADLSDFAIELSNNGNNVNLKKDNTNFGDSDGESSTDLYIYTSGALTNESASVFTDIDTNNLNALSEGLSLFDIIQSVDNYSIYLETSTEGGGSEYWTIKQNGIVVQLSNSEAFSFVEFETIWK